jgi:hypothetical protein
MGRRVHAPFAKNMSNVAQAGKPISDCSFKGAGLRYEDYHLFGPTNGTKHPLRSTRTPPGIPLGNSRPFRSSKDGSPPTETSQSVWRWSFHVVTTS